MVLEYCPNLPPIEKLMGDVLTGRDVLRFYNLFYLTLFSVFQSLSLAYSLCRSVVPFLFTVSFIFHSCALEFQQSDLFGDRARTVEASRTVYIIVSSSRLDAHFHFIHETGGSQNYGRDPISK